MFEVGNALSGDLRVGVSLMRDCLPHGVPHLPRWPDDVNEGEEMFLMERSRSRGRASSGRYLADESHRMVVKIGGHKDEVGRSGDGDRQGAGSA